MPESIQFNEAKFKELLLYAAGRCEEDPRCGSTKLNKILFSLTSTRTPNRAAHHRG